LLALGMGPAGDRLWDLASGRELGLLPSGGRVVPFQTDGRAIFTFGDQGACRWPIQMDDNSLRVGPPQKIALPFEAHRARRSWDGQTLALVSETAEAGLLLDTATLAQKGPRFPHPRASDIALSPDNKWVATTGWHSDRVRLWNAKTGAMVHEWVLGLMNR